MKLCLSFQACRGARTRYQFALEKEKGDIKEKIQDEKRRRNAEALVEIREEEARASAILQAATRRRRELEQTMNS